MSSINRPSAIRTVLFDLDGTLVDTAPDLGFTLNELRHRRGLVSLAEAEFRPQASHGSQGLIRLGFGVNEDHPDFPALREEFLEIYEAHLNRNSPLFPGMGEVLSTLEEKGLNWGVVTNKPTRLTEPLLRHLGLAHRAACIVCGDTLAWNKPHPAPMLHACRLAGSEPFQCLYVGDAQRDMDAATAAGMPALVALYGYLGAEDRPYEWGAIGHIESPAGLLDWLGGTA
jgi:N-acetyl-D-muramate 6-phosphate phosphatase